MTTGEKILAMRKARHWSQEELAEWIGVSRQAVSRWESGSAMPDSDKLIALCECFGVSADYLLGIETGKGEIREPMEQPSTHSGNRLSGYQIIGTVFALFGIFCRIGLELLGVFRPFTLYSDAGTYQGLRAYIHTYNLYWVMVLVWALVLMGSGMLLWPFIKKRIPKRNQALNDCKNDGNMIC